MPASRKRSLMEPEAHEATESAAEEVREGSESSEYEPLKKPTSRKRSAKGTKNTKAPFDAEGCGCGAKKSHKMDSALTPHEYLSACELGIQDRSRSYIRTRLTVMDSLTPASLQFRFDKKCGNSSIPDNKQCRAGAGGGGQMLRRVATGAAIAGGVAAAAYGASRMRRGSSPPRLAPSGGMPLARNTMGNRARRAAYNAGSAVRGAATNLTEGARSGSFTRAGSIANRARQARYAVQNPMAASRNLRRSVRSVGQRVGSGINSARFATRSGASFTAGNSLGNTARRAVYGGSMAIRRGAARMSAKRPPSVTGGLALRRRGDDDVWAVGFEPQYA